MRRGALLLRLVGLPTTNLTSFPSTIRSFTLPQLARRWIAYLRLYSLTWTKSFRMLCLPFLSALRYLRAISRVMDFFSPIVNPTLCLPSAVLAEAGIVQG